MKVIALISGGKDSCFSMMQCVAEGHSIVALANLKPHSATDELDSYMYQTVGHHAITLYGDAMELPLFRRTITGSSTETGKNYFPNSADEVEDLFELLKTIKDRIPDADAVSCGAILSDYQRVRVESVCSRLNLTVLSYLWRREQSQLLEEMIECGVEAIVIKVAALGLKPNEHLGKSIKEIFPHMVKMKEQWGLNVCGEGGEYETFVTDCPLFARRIVVYNSDIVIHSDDAFAPVGYINLLSAHLVNKPDVAGLSQAERIRSIPITRSTDTVDEMLDNYSTDTVLPNNDAAVIYTCENGSNQVLGDVTPEFVMDSLGNFCISGLMAQRQSASLQKVITNCMESLKECIELKLNSQLKDISFVHLFLSSMADFSVVNTIYKSYFSINPPARVCVEAVLPAGVIFQLDCIGCRNHNERQAMHVQCISHWAPANIGPYSQAIRDGRWVKISGQIGLVPGSMQLVEGGIGCESALALRHIQRILTALHTGVNMFNVVFCISYVTDENYIPIAKHQYRLAVPEKEVPFGECPSSLHPLIHYVVVPALPRGALVEWEVTAFTDSSHFNYTETFEDFSECRIRSEMLASDDFNDYVAKISVDTKCRPADIQLDLDLSSLASHIGSHLIGKQLKDCNTVGNMTVFYPGKTFSYQNVIQGLHASMKSSLKGKKLTISAIPVLKLEFSSRTFSIFLYRMCSTMPTT